ncbi:MULTISPECIES: hypothetical protein [Pseudothermotoga]|jgi:hypothetical protein|uniref:Uncharacterized protein n=1 Tax=Pseudothermotoga lettingae (strain ATCC BAA-301 / DSM 14385 / NBRC 107922 / TMO) TaxID=416591 RepID=A8F4H3_PSELT|nr:MULTISPECIES: hypothetical protein [Pseudothermotoga]ABV33057.1 hypothetical protein Tlet_0490 [Pseudothermotoga lettingae TMO]KUK22044.1 MAG: Uncharacterized protein XD56_0008 [Pseudothermotoga lettingae]MDI3494274.1 hypothetical protein [Pseudothermotoga sp.]GLI47941.1 hypothetical protein PLETTINGATMO_01100 [Pseudothermotoga lettingae TMO]HBJ81378.1 hypothetical protein [Pseudothermotoga sp.]
MFWVKILVFIIISILLVKIAKKPVSSEKNIRESLINSGWKCCAGVKSGKTWIGLYRKSFQKKIVLICENSLNFADVKKAVVMALLSNTRLIKLYCSEITPHAQKALNKLSKTKKLHRIKFVQEERFL